MASQDTSNRENSGRTVTVQEPDVHSEAYGVQIVAPQGNGRGSHYITVPTIEGDSVQTIMERAMTALHQTGATMVSMEIVGLPMLGGLPEIEGATGPINWPVTWISGPTAHMHGGIQLWAERDATVTPIMLGKEVAGSLVDTPDATICRLGGLNGRIPTRTPKEQAQSVLHQLEEALLNAGMDFSHTVRTWYYNCEIVSWYEEFNRTRDAFFTEHRVYEGLLPASTGIGACNVSSSSIVGGLLAVKPKSGTVTMAEIPSPLQCSATDYGSSFSRAAEINFPTHRQVLISGTASIEPHGKTVHSRDVDAQIDVTMEVVKAILQSRDMNWSNVTRALAYVKRAEDISHFERYRRKLGLEALPVVTMVAEVCRDDLLFEIEVDAIGRH